MRAISGHIGPTAPAPAAFSNETESLIHIAIARQKKAYYPGVRPILHRSVPLPWS